MNTKLYSNPVFYLALAAYIVLGYTVLGFDNQIVAAAIREDHYFEAVGALSFFVTSILFFLAFLNSYKVQGQSKHFVAKRLICLGLAFIFFFGAGEEISWGQRIFGVETPESIGAVNDQGEITVHNLSFGGANIPFETIFDLFWMSYVVALPLLSAFYKPFGRFVERFAPMTHGGIGLLFLGNYLWAKLAKLLYVSVYHYDRVPFRQAVQEIKESNYALLFVPAALYVLLKMREMVNDAPLPGRTN